MTRFKSFENMAIKTTITISHGQERWIVMADGHPLTGEISEIEARDFAKKLYNVLKNVRLIEWNGDTQKQTVLEER